MPLKHEEKFWRVRIARTLMEPIKKLAKKRQIPVMHYIALVLNDHILKEDLKDSVRDDLKDWG